MKHRILLTLLLTVGALRGADDPLAQARAALDRNELDAAEATLTPLVSEAAADPRARLYLSQVRARQGRTKEAIILAEQAVAAAPSAAEYHSNLGTILAQRSGEVNFMHQAVIAHRMLAAFKKSVELDANHIPGYIGLARYYTFAPSIAGGSRETAEQQAAEIEKRSPQLGRQEYGHIAEHFGDYGQAREWYARASAAEPQAAWLHEAMGRMSEKLQKPDEAKACYEQAIALEPGRASARDALARLAAAKG